MKQPGYYAILPASVRYDDRINSSQKVFFSEITALSNKRGYCSASNNYFARLYKVSKSTISAWVRGLSDAGHIRVDYIRAENIIVQRRMYPITHKKEEGGGSQKTDQGWSENLNGGGQKIATPWSENLKENTTSINTTRDNTTRELVVLFSHSEIFSSDEFIVWYERYLSYMKEQHGIESSSISILADIERLEELLADGNDPIKVIRQTIQARNKKLYELSDYSQPDLYENLF